MTERKFVQSKGVLVQRTTALRNRSVSEALNSGALDSLAGEEPLLVIGRLGKLFHLNVSGALIWEGLREPSTISQLSQTLGESFAVLPSQATRSVEQLLDLLVANKLAGAVDPG